jgi:hypothetical protein
MYRIMRYIESVQHAFMFFLTVQIATYIVKFRQEFKLAAEHRHHTYRH